MDRITDENNNVATIAYWGSEEAARASLATLKNCKDCINCSDCSDCSGCSRCYDCSGCSRCYLCSYCSYCSGCSDCSDCSRCYDCSDCSGCSGCSRCSDCLRCSGCSGYSHIAYLIDRKNLRGDPTAAPGTLGQPPVPKIENIHARVFQAASQPGALNMSDWHTCGTAHCRAGWVVDLAGEAGYALERFHNTALAAQLIYRESGYLINPGKFYVTNEEALADMQRLAEAEAAA